MRNLLLFWSSSVEMTMWLESAPWRDGTLLVTAYWKGARFNPYLHIGNWVLVSFQVWDTFGSCRSVGIESWTRSFICSPDSPQVLWLCFFLFVLLINCAHDFEYRHLSIYLFQIVKHTLYIMSMYFEQRVRFCIAYSFIL